jgi:hypothetical protein
MSIFAKGIAEELPEILTPINVSNNTVTVTWLTTIADIVNIVVIVKNIESNYSVVVGPNERTVTVEVVDPAPYNVTVVVFDICKNNYSSIPETVGVRVESSSASLFGTTVTLQSTPSPLTTFEKTTSPSHSPTPTSQHPISSPYMFSSNTPRPSPSKQCNPVCCKAAIALGIVLVLITIIYSMILLILVLVWFQKSKRKENKVENQCTDSAISMDEVKV